MQALLEEMRDNRGALARSTETMAEHTQLLRMLPCAGHEIRIAKQEGKMSRLQGAGAVISGLIVVASTIVAAVL